ncbi:MAG TPA: dynamin family protein [Candidatus Aquilonibacter sp.]|nr:dynamin family protein [Candidatus Aquilonibacter sp.]
MSSGDEKSREALNPFQANRLRITCQYIDKLLVEVEEILNSAGSRSAFPRYAEDILPAQRRTIEDYIARVRAQLVRVLEGQRIAREKPAIPASRAVHVHLGAIDIAVEELKPKYMRGYGEVPEGVATELNGIVGELSGLVQRLDRYLSEGVGEDLKARLERLDRAGNDLRSLKKVEEVVRVRGLVEFRPSIAAILDRAEDKSFEIAVFGRVSSGKSSLLNAILETNALPVGVTPITAVPTRIVHAQGPSLTVWFSEASTKKLPIAELPEFATEQHNPGNSKHVVRLVIALPSPALQSGVTFVDTPGLGSLATSGARETLAYLPKCDLGVVLIDAGATLAAEDLQTIMALQQAAIPVNVLLSKADLLSAQDRQRIVTYVNEHIASECRLDLPVHPVSVVPSCRGMLDDWFKHQITPLYARSQELRAASLRRKIGALRDSVTAALQARLNRREQASADGDEGARAAEETLRKATGIIAEMRSVSARYTENAANTVQDAVGDAAKRLVEAWSRTGTEPVAPEQLVRQSLTGFSQAQVATLQREITALAVQLNADLRRCAADLGISDAPGEDEFQSVVRGSPVFEAPSFEMQLSHPGLGRVFGRNAVERSVAKQISRQLPQSFYAAVEAYWQLVKAWSASVIGQLSKRFESYAENYRAQAEVALGGHEVTKQELDGIAESLASIKADAAR